MTDAATIDAIKAGLSTVDADPIAWLLELVERQQAELSALETAARKVVQSMHDGDIAYIDDLEALLDGRVRA